MKCWNDATAMRQSGGERYCERRASAPGARPRGGRAGGFATTAAIVLMGLIGVALLTLTSSVARDARRLRDARDQAQARQLLLAANVLIVQGADVSKPLALPDAVRAEGGELTVTPGDAGQFIIVARAGRARVGEVLTVADESGRRTVRDVRFE